MSRPTPSTRPISFRMRSSGLALEPLTVEHLEPVHALWCEPGVRRYLWDNQLIDRDRAAEPLRASEADFRKRKFGLWGLYFLDTISLAGFCGLRIGKLFPEPELLFGLSEAYWGRGLATEAASVVLGYAFDDLGLPEVGAATDVPNIKSARVLERIGMKMIKRGDHNGLDTFFYNMTRSEWQAIRSDRSVPRSD